MAAEEVKAFPTLAEINYFRLLRMQLQPQSTEDFPGDLKRLSGLALRAAEHDPIVRIADERAETPRGERSVKGVQVDVR